MAMVSLTNSTMQQSVQWILHMQADRTTTMKIPSPFQQQQQSATVIVMDTIMNFSTSACSKAKIHHQTHTPFSESMLLFCPRKGHIPSTSKELQTTCSTLALSK